MARFAQLFYAFRRAVLRTCNHIKGVFIARGCAALESIFVMKTKSKNPSKPMIQEATPEVRVERSGRCALN